MEAGHLVHKALLEPADNATSYKLRMKPEDVDVFPGHEHRQKHMHTHTHTHIHTDTTSTGALLLGSVPVTFGYHKTEAWAMIVFTECCGLWGRVCTVLTARNF